MSCLSRGVLHSPWVYFIWEGLVVFWWVDGAVHVIIAIAYCLLLWASALCCSFVWTSLDKLHVVSNAGCIHATQCMTWSVTSFVIILLAFSASAFLRKFASRLDLLWWKPWRNFWHTQLILWWLQCILLNLDWRGLVIVALAALEYWILELRIIWLRGILVWLVSWAKL